MYLLQNVALLISQWILDLFCRQNHEKWEDQGRTSLLNRARTKLHNILDNHQPVAIAPEKHQAIKEIVNLFD